MEKIKNGITEMVFILDRSGSMSGMEKDTIGGFNSLIEKQKKEDGKAFISTVLFDGTCEVLHDRIDINEIKPMTEDEYYVRGCTALIDALGGAIHHIANIHKYARKEDVPENTVFVIITDGYENASHRFTSDEVKEMVEKEKSKYGWEFLFLGANIDAVETARKYGINEDRAVDYKCDSVGTAYVYKNVSDAVHMMRCDAKIDEDWCVDIKADYKKRGRK